MNASNDDARRALVLEWRASGVSRAAFCREKGLSPSSLARWERKLMGTLTAPEETVVNDTRDEPAEAAQPEIDLGDPRYYLNRELTWLDFNSRVLSQGEDPRVPLLERVKFLAIADSTLDEFVMKRVGGLKQQVGAGVQERTVDGLTAQEQIDACYARIRPRYQRKQALLETLVAELAEHGIRLADYADLDATEQAALRERYLENVFPLVTPQAMDPAHPFPFLSNLSLNLLVALSFPNEPHPRLARVKVPVGAGAPRFMRLGDTFVPLEQVMAHNLDLLFPDMHVETCSMFRVIRNANTVVDEDLADDLLAMIETELRERRFAPVVALQVESSMPEQQRGMLAAESGLDPEVDVFTSDGLLGLGDLMSVAALPRLELHDPPHHPHQHPSLLGPRNIFHQIRERGPILLYHPFDAFSSSVVRLLEEAANDPKVRAIKTTLYRTESDSEVIKHLIAAALNGKQVAVLVELKARFDEHANIRWAKGLEEVGIHVTYGVVGLKTHCKAILVVRQDYNGLTRYAHVGTGNYHSGTARLYTDLGLLTCGKHVGQDLTELFNYLTTGYKPKRNYKRLLVAPKLLKSGLLERIEREIACHADGRGGLIQIKTNALEDADMVRALYRASQAGVTVDLLVRDSCRLRAGVPGLSENIRVISIVGRFLEHARIVYFRNGGDEEYFIGSADLMQRNLESRVEVLVAVRSDAEREDLRRIINTQLADERGAWEMQPDGRYLQRQPSSSETEKDSQQLAMLRVEARFREATRLRKRKPKGIARRRR